MMADLTLRKWQRAGHFEPIVCRQTQCLLMLSSNWPTTGKPEAIRNRFFRSRHSLEAKSATGETKGATERTGQQKNATTSLRSRRAQFVWITAFNPTRQLLSTLCRVLSVFKPSRSLETTQPGLLEDEKKIVLEQDIFTPIVTQAPEVTVARMSACRQQIVICWRQRYEYRS